jgi:hypothetical protein
MRAIRKNCAPLNTYDIPITSEIMTRTAPNFLDLMIALAGGVAGAYATVSFRLSLALVGVAIATALVPPLASAGILLARGEISLALGALELGHCQSGRDPVLRLCRSVANRFSSRYPHLRAAYYKVPKAESAEHYHPGGARRLAVS